MRNYLSIVYGELRARVRPWKNKTKTIMACIFLVLSLLAAATEASVSPRQADQSTITYESFVVESTIVARYATTRITSVVLNSAPASRELDFQMQLPETAFISSFNM